jgi:thiol-disulfide isomerase/thioredoxin
MIKVLSWPLSSLNLLRYRTVRCMMTATIQLAVLSWLALAGHAKPASPTLQPVSVAALKKQIAARKGQVVLVNFWATWCLPCKAEFPALLKLRQKYQPKGLSMLFVSADEMSSRNSTALPFLRSQKVKFPTYIIGTNPGTFVEQFDPKLNGAFALPRTYIYNRQGKLIRVFSADKSFAEWEKVVKPLL